MGTAMTTINFRFNFIICGARAWSQRRLLCTSPDVLANDGASDRRLHVTEAALWLPKPFVTQPGVGSQRMKRKIIRPFRQVDFMNVDGLRALSHQNFLS